MASATTAQLLTLSRLLIADSNIAPLRRHPQAEESEKLVIDFMNKHGVMFPNFHHANTMYAYMYPTGSFERVTVVGKIMGLLFHIDDVYADTAESRGLMGGELQREVIDRIDRCAYAFETGVLMPYSGGLERAFQELRHEMQNQVDPAWMVRFADALRTHITYAVNPIGRGGWKSDGTVPYEKYAYLREIVSGMLLSVDLIEYMNEVCLPDYIVYYPTISRLRQTCSRIAAFGNDLFSYEKEVLREGTRFNLVAVIQANRRCSFEEAVDRAIEIVNEETRHFYKLANEIACWDDEINAMVRQYVDGMIYHMSATWGWQLRTLRYRSEQSPFIETRGLNLDHVLAQR
jgi:hypothetical protein